MATRYDFYFRQLVTESDLDDAFDELEKADRAIMADAGLSGVYSLAAVTQHAGTPNISVDVSGPGVVYDQLGQRVLIPSLQNKDVSADDALVTTAVAAPGNEKWLSLFVKFERTLSDPQVDGNSNTVFFVRSESFKFSLLQGSEAVIPNAVRPALIGDGILLADIRRTNGQTQILNADISTTRRQSTFKVAGLSRSLDRGQLKDALADITTWYNNHVNGLADPHVGASVNYAGGPNWLDGTTNPGPVTIEVQMDKFITDLVSVSGPNSGSQRIGSGQITGSINNIASGSIFSQMLALKSAGNLEYGGGGAWADGVTNPAATMEAAIDKIFSDLASTSGSGAHKIGASAIVGTSATIPAGSVRTQLVALQTASNHDLAARTAWLGGRTNPATTLQLGVDKIITDLSATTASDDGAERIGAQAAGDLVLGSVRSQLNQLDTEWARLARLNTFTARQTFQGGISLGTVGAGVGGGIRYRSATISDGTGITLDTDADHYFMSSPAANRLITLRDTTGTPLPALGDSFTVCRPLAGAFTFTFEREDGTVVVLFPASDFAWAEFVFTTVWRLRRCSDNCTQGAGA